MTQAQTHDDLRLAVEAAKAGGALAAKHFRTEVHAWEKGADGPVSEVDIAVNDLIEAHLRTARPTYGWLSEETKDNDERLSAERLWVVDPIDGTRAYLSGLPEYCISIACVEHGRPICAALYDPSADAMYTAQRGGGAHLNGAVMSVSGWAEPLTSKLILAQDMTESELWPQPWAPRALTRPNSMALRIAWVASGAYDLTMALSEKQDWDLAAADLILAEAGGTITTHHGEPLTYNTPTTGHPFVVAATPAVHDTACAQVRGLIANYQARQAHSQ